MKPKITDLADRKFQKDLNTGVTALVLLMILAQAEDAMYGYQIAKLIKKEASTIKQGTIYPVLRGLENTGLLESAVNPSISGPPRRYYQINDEGRDTLKRWTHIWQQTKSLVDNIANGGES